MDKPVAWVQKTCLLPKINGAYFLRIWVKEPHRSEIIVAQTNSTSIVIYTQNRLPAIRQCQHEFPRRSLATMATKKGRNQGENPKKGLFYFGDDTIRIELPK